MNLVWCEVCGTRPAMFNESRCEDCWAADQDRYDHRRRVHNIHTMVNSSREVNDVPVSGKPVHARNEIKAGDIIGFSGDSWISACVNIATYGIPFWGLSHVGIMGHADDGRLLLFESTQLDDLPCEITGEAFLRNAGPRVGTCRSSTTRERSGTIRSIGRCIRPKTSG